MGGEEGRTLSVDGVLVVFDDDFFLGVLRFSLEGARFFNDLGCKRLGRFDVAVVGEELSDQLFDEEVFVQWRDEGRYARRVDFFPNL